MCSRLGSREISNWKYQWMETQKATGKILLPLTNRMEKGSTAKQDFETITTLLWANTTGRMVALPSSPPARPSYSSEDLDSVHLYDLEVIEVLPSKPVAKDTWPSPSCRATRLSLLKIEPMYLELIARAFREASEQN